MIFTQIKKQQTNTVLFLYKTNDFEINSQLTLIRRAKNKIYFAAWKHGTLQFKIANAKVGAAG